MHLHGSDRSRQGKENEGALHLMLVMLTSSGRTVPSEGAQGDKVARHAGDSAEHASAVPADSLGLLGLGLLGLLHPAEELRALRQTPRVVLLYDSAVSMHKLLCSHQDAEQACVCQLAGRGELTADWLALPGVLQAPPDQPSSVCIQVSRLSHACILVSKALQGGGVCLPAGW